MRILHFIYDHMGNPWVGGGGAARAYEINRRLAPRHEITIVSGKYPGARDYSEGNLRFHFEGTDKNNYVLSTFCYAVKAARCLRAHAAEADVVVEDFSPYNPLFSFAKRRDAVLQVHQKEGLHILRKYLFLGLPFFLLEKYYPRMFKTAVTISEGCRQKHGLSDKAAVLPNGFDESYLSVSPEDGRYMLFMGRLEIDQKGLDILIEAAKALDGVDIRLAGKGKDEGKLRALLSAPGLKSNVELAGFLSGEAKIDAMRRAMFVLVPSRFEGQAVIVLEAAAFGKPVIVSDIPENMFAVEAGFGVAFKSGSPEDLAEKIKLLSGDSALRGRMGQKAREFAAGFTWEGVAGRYERFLEEAVARGGGSKP